MLLVRAAAALLACISLYACGGQKIIYEGRSMHGPLIVTEDERGIRTLLFEKNGARQSVVNPRDPDDLELAYARATLVGLALVDDPRRALVIGLGGGTLPTFLRRHYPAAQIDVVDIDPQVIEVAKSFFGFREDDRMHAHVADGRKFIEQHEGAGYDLVILDAYGADSVPRHLATVEFLQSVRRAMSPQGVALANVWSERSNALYRQMLRSYQDAFEEVVVLDAPDAANKIFAALPRARGVSQAELVRRARVVTQSRRMPLDLADLAERSYTSAGSVKTDAPPLTDAELEPAAR